MKRTLCILFFLMSACCTKEDCICDNGTMVFSYPNVTDENTIQVIVTDKQFNQQDTFESSVYLGYKFLEITEGIYPSTRNLEDHNFIVKNLSTGDIDTITDITNSRNPYEVKCNDCFLGRDLMQCERVTSQTLRLNGLRIDGDTLVFN